MWTRTRLHQQKKIDGRKEESMTQATRYDTGEYQKGEDDTGKEDTGIDYIAEDNTNENDTNNDDTGEDNRVYIDKDEDNKCEHNISEKKGE